MRRNTTLIHYISSAIRYRIRRLGRRISRYNPLFPQYREVIQLIWCNEAWPVYANIFPEPFIYQPSEQDKMVTDKHVKFASHNIVLPPVMVHLIPNGCIFPRTGVITDASGRIIIESSRSYNAVLELNENRPILRKTKTFKGDCPVTVINVEAYKFYYHWLIDVLPRLYALGQLNERVVLLLPPGLSPTQLKLLDYCLPDNVQLQRLNNFTPIRARQVLLSPITSIQGIGVLRPELLDFLRSSILPKCEQLDNGRPRPRRIYISREKAPKRRVLNEDQLLPILDRYDIQKVFAEDLTIEEQVLLFRDAELIVSPHGGGLTNMIFARNAAIVEIFPNGERPPWNLPIHYWGLAKSCGHRYYFIFHANQDIHTDIRVDPERLERIIDEAASGKLEVKEGHALYAGLPTGFPELLYTVRRNTRPAEYPHMVASR